MNLKIAIATFLVLMVAILFYPPFHWTSQDMALDAVMRNQLPVKKRAIIFGPSSQKFQLKHFPENIDTKKSPEAAGQFQDQLKNYSDEELERIIGIIPLQRSLAWPDLGVEIVMGCAISVLSGVITARRKRQSPNK